MPALLSSLARSLSTAARDAARRMAAGARAARVVVGAPDYDRYLAHHARCHPDAAPLSRDSFVEAALRARYERPGSRCC